MTHPRGATKELRVLLVVLLVARPSGAPKLFKDLLFAPPHWPILSLDGPWSASDVKLLATVGLPPALTPCRRGRLGFGSLIPVQ